MTERTVQQQELDLDAFWNDLVSGLRRSASTTSETAVVERLASVGLAPQPRAGFLDDLWTRMLESDQLESPTPETEQPAVQVVAPVVPLPLRPNVHSRRRYQRWGRLAAAIAALLVIAAAGAIFFAARKDDTGPAPAAQWWSMIGGGPGKTNGNPESSPIADPSVHWRTETDGRVEGAPVMADGVVFIGNQEHHLYALDAETGLERWEANLRKPVVHAAAVGNGIVVVGTTTSLHGLDAKTGDTLWQRDDLIAQSAPAIVGETIFVVDAELRIRALALDTGADVWSSDAFASPPAFAIDERDNRLIVTTPDGTARALSTGDGAELWQASPGLGTLGPPLVDGEAVFVPIEGGVLRIDGATGEIGPKNQLPFDSIPFLGLAGDRLVASTDVMVVSYDRDTLDVQWSNQLLTGLTGGLTIGSSSIYLPGSDRTLTALDLENGDVQWTLPLDEVAQVAPAATSDRLYIATRGGSVYAISGGEATILNAPPAETVAEAEGPVQPLWKSSGGPNALKNPTGIAVSPTGEVWVCDTANDRLQIFDRDGNFLREFGSHGSEPGQFDFGEETAEMDGSAPLGNACNAAFDAAGALYVADAANQRVQRFPASELDWMIHSCCTIEAAGTAMPYPASSAQPDLIIGSEGTGEGQFLFASDVAIAPNGDIYVGDRRRLDVQRFDANGNYLETIGEPTVRGSDDQPIVEDALAPGSFMSIDGIAVDRVGALYVADDEANQIDRFDPDGSWTVLQLSRGDYRINGIGVDDQGNVFVTQIETIGGSFAIYDPEGKPLVKVGKYGTGLGEFDGTSGVALDAQGNVYLTDWGLNRFQKFEIDYEQLDAEASG